MKRVEITDDPFKLQAKAKAKAIKQQGQRLKVQRAQLAADKARQRANTANAKLTKTRNEP